jgi:tetratricopeptide (TPR) repeat protein
MQKRKIALLLCGFAVASAPFTGLETIWLPPDRAYAETNNDPYRLVQDAYRMFKENGALPPEIIDQLKRHQESLLPLLRSVAETTEDITTEQLIDSYLVREHGDVAAARRLHESGMKHGFSVSLDGLTERFLADHFPNGKLRQGIEAYEKIRGVPYFYHMEIGGTWLSYQSRGDDFDNPREAKGRWLSFMENNPNHPALDDAAYRLARCYQQLGEYERALYWFHEAKSMGDRDLFYDTNGHYLFVLDVDMTAAQLAQLDTSRLPAWTKPWAAYSLAVEYLRERKYAQASAALQQFVDTYEKDDAKLFGHEKQTALLRTKEYPFWQQVKEQLSLAKTLADMQAGVERASGAEKARRQYELAALIYHNPLLYYNHLWRGERQDFFWFGQIKQMEYNERLDQYIGRFNHLVQAIDVFSGINLNEADAVTGAKTLYSLMVAHSKLLEYGEEVKYYASKAMLGERILENGRKLLKLYPDSEFADDALLLMYAYTNDAALLQELLTRYPQSDQAGKAKQLAQENSAQKERTNWRDPLRSTLPYQTLDTDDWRIPAKVKDWMAQWKGKVGQRTMRDGEWLYAYIVPKAGERAYVTIETDRNGVYFQYAGEPLTQSATHPDHGDVLIRLPYRFVQHAPVTWSPIGQ